MPSFCGQSNTVSMRLILEGCCILYGARTCTKKNQTTMFSLLYILTHSTLYGNNFSSHTNHFTKEFQIYIYTWCTGLFWTCRTYTITKEHHKVHLWFDSEKKSYRSEIVELHPFLYGGTNRSLRKLDFCFMICRVQTVGRAARGGYQNVRVFTCKNKQYTVVS